MYEERCEHLTEGEVPQPNSSTCDECSKAGQTPVQLRICRTCGHVGCCDSSPGKHATAHFHETKHPIIQTFEPGDDWGWCYEHKKGIGPFPPAR
ncbi:MAG: UBP-type zinc finger domain-containing protein [SAR324 cluster bacterium]|nr:UBP-type zinc finger domain-containing protein [SAR324 cluster bacterium]MCZ6531683.1 UBP-type zinc finger domain-containing protein [SAR324 cluster bacterium]MCZ6646075.1 UBP-type zinc finger domain-containing protein [SAR324 cluster bacterium]MCZ6843509.1 UBP-type zinc finger domain-containing protein [SAR324 cluster bacterium]